MITHLIIGFFVFLGLFFGLATFGVKKHKLDERVWTRVDRYEAAPIIIGLVAMILTLAATLALAVSL